MLKLLALLVRAIHYLFNDLFQLIIILNANYLILYFIFSLYDSKGQNPGREYFTCSRPSNEKCNFFEWTDEPPQWKKIPQSWSDNNHNNRLNAANKKYRRDDGFENRHFKGHSKTKKSTTTNTSVISLTQFSSFLISKKYLLYSAKINIC